MIDFKNYIFNINLLANKFLGIDEVNSRIELVNGFDNELKNGKVPSKNLFTLVFSEAELIKILTINPDISSLQDLDNYLSYFRQYLQEKYGYWASITEPFLNSFLKNINFNSCLELMSGNAYISKYLMENNKIIFPTDSKLWAKNSKTGDKSLVNVEKIDALDAIDKYSSSVDIIMLAWSPDFDEIDYQILQKYRKISDNKPSFFLIGEPYGATNSKKFWNNVNINESKKVDEINHSYSNYDIVNDQLYLIN